MKKSSRVSITIETHSPAQKSVNPRICARDAYFEFKRKQGALIPWRSLIEAKFSHIVANGCMKRLDEGYVVSILD